MTKLGPSALRTADRDDLLRNVAGRLGRRGTSHRPNIPELIELLTRRSQVDALGSGDRRPAECRPSRQAGQEPWTEAAVYSIRRREKTS
jgi:hypothetical protein